MKSKIYFRGSQKHGAALIEALEAMGGRNFWRLTGIEEQYLYAIDEKNRIISIKPNEVLYDDLLKSGMEIRVEEIPDKADADVGKELAETLAQFTWADLFLSMILLFSDCLKTQGHAQKAPRDPKPEKWEYAVGEEFDFGLVRLKVVEGLGCKGCVFEQYCEKVRKTLLVPYVGPCYREYRSDGRSVQFVKAE